mmetsp:Transcript_4185/g.7560  ORF Transcript_4185/g.7560 Transcript_4185/m.7560 type:complete len:83 (-) Transcript_4185:10-258(-)
MAAGGVVAAAFRGALLDGGGGGGGGVGGVGGGGGGGSDCCGGISEANPGLDIKDIDLAWKGTQAPSQHVAAVKAAVKGTQAA